jgi:hypothetical protein
MGRKPIEIDEAQVYKLAALHATNQEIADFFDVSPDTIERRFAAVLTKARASRKIKLRQLQWRAAERLNPTMLIFLGKNLLGQSDKQEAKDQDSPSTSQVQLSPSELLELIKQAKGGS